MLLLVTLGSTRPGEAPGALAAALTLVAVIAEQDIRARTYAAFPDTPYWCKCGFRCRGLAAINAHLDQLPLNSDAHCEVSGASLAAAVAPDTT